MKTSSHRANIQLESSLNNLLRENCSRFSSGYNFACQLFIAVAIILLSVQPCFSKNKVKVACIGASITYGARITDREHNSYPAQLQQLLGNQYTVINYGVSGSTMLKKGNQPYWNTTQYQQALTDRPDIVIIDLGGNDAKLVNRIYMNEFEQDCREMVRSFRQLPSHPRVLLLLAMPSFVKDTSGIYDPVIIKQVNPHIQNVAYTDAVEVIDMHAPFADKEALMQDKIHPDATGAAIMAKEVFDVIGAGADNDFNVFTQLPPHTTNSFYGYVCASFKLDGHNCNVVQPKFAAKGHPWVWRARFWGHEPQADISLLQRGYHIVYCDVAELFGNNVAIAAWNKFYALLYKAGLAKKTILEGMSRGGVYALNWAAENPRKVAGVYIDNPVLDLKSWPGGVGNAVKSPKEQQQFMDDYQLKTTDDIKAFKGSPIDKIPAIVKGKYPMLILCADADEALPPSENTLPFEQQVKALGGNITVIHKPGFKHHPHSFPNPALITQFIVNAFNQHK